MLGFLQLGGGGVGMEGQYVTIVARLPITMVALNTLTTMVSHKVVYGLGIRAWVVLASMVSLPGSAEHSTTRWLSMPA